MKTRRNRSIERKLRGLSELVDLAQAELLTINCDRSRWAKQHRRVLQERIAELGRDMRRVSENA